jgi:hypothetical protein
VKFNGTNGGVPEVLAPEMLEMLQRYDPIEDTGNARVGMDSTSMMAAHYRLSGQLSNRIERSHSKAHHFPQHNAAQS